MSSEKYQIEENKKIDVDVEKSQNEKNESEKKQLLSEEFLLDLQMIAAIVFILMLTGVILFVKVFTKKKTSLICWFIFLAQIYYLTPGNDENASTFKPIDQNKLSNQKYTGMGFVPCNGHLPCQVNYQGF